MAISPNWWALLPRYLTSGGTGYLATYRCDTFYTTPLLATHRVCALDLPHTPTMGHLPHMPSPQAASGHWTAHSCATCGGRRTPHHAGGSSARLSHTEKRRRTVGEGHWQTDFPTPNTCTCRTRAAAYPCLTLGLHVLGPGSIPLGLLGVDGWEADPPYPGVPPSMMHFPCGDSPVPTKPKKCWTTAT